MATDSGGGPDVIPDVIDNPDNCVKPGTANNTQGIGGYCSPSGGQCATAGPGGTPTLCSADYSTTPNAWFCTAPCPANCGSGAACVATATGAICAPTACLGYLGDAGILTDGGAGEGAASDGGVADAGEGGAADAASDGPSAD
jgi:hypothetical protein